MTQPEKISEIYKRLSENYLTFAENGNEWDAQGLSSSTFKNLVSVTLSTMTHTKRVIAACTALYAKAETPQDILTLDDDELITLIKPVAHYNRKAKHLKTMCHQLLTRHNGQVPNTKKELLALQGVGMKCADLIMNFNFGSADIAIDTHIQRVLNRLGIVKTTSAKQTSLVINAITPESYKKHAHEWLIQHGMNVCTARAPQCEKCLLSDLCDWQITRQRQ